MTTVDTFDTPAPIPRDRFGRPLVVPPGGGKAVPYTRCTTFVDCLEDKWNLQLWQQRMVALGLVDRPDLLLSVAASRHDKQALNKVVERAREAAAADAAATTGTAQHALCEQIDRGQRLGIIPAAYQGDLDAYRRATACLRMVEIEQFCVLDEHRIGGTPDRVALFNGRYYIADIKTGTLDFGLLKMAMQFAVYSRCELYDIDTQQRIPRPYTVDTEQAILIHLPAGEGDCTLYFIDINAGWQAVQVAIEVRQWRSRTKKFWLRPFTPTTPPDLAAAIAAADSLTVLRELWRSHDADGTWTEHHTIAARARRAQLEGHAA